MTIYWAHKRDAEEQQGTLKSMQVLKQYLKNAVILGISLLSCFVSTVCDAFFTNSAFSACNLYALLYSLFLFENNIALVT